jgi:hypothetical protein
VEGEIGRFRRHHLVPIPAVASLAALNQLIAAADMVDVGRVITGRPVTIAAAFAQEQLAMAPLPGSRFDPARLLQARVDARARVCVRQNYYSVPARYAGRRLPVRLSATAGGEPGRVQRVPLLGDAEAVQAHARGLERRGGQGGVAPGVVVAASRGDDHPGRSDDSGSDCGCPERTST